MGSHQVYKSLITICEMMTDRGLEDISTELQKITLQDIISMMSQRNVLTIDIGTRFRLVYALAGKFKIVDVKKLLEEDFEMIMLVTKEKMSSTNAKTIDDMKKEIQVFDIRELQFNISKHKLVPKHELISAENEGLIQELITKHCIKTKTQFPLILKTDPMAKYLNAKPGSIIKITRFSPTSGEHIVYRCCI